MKLKNYFINIICKRTPNTKKQWRNQIEKFKSSGWTRKEEKKIFNINGINWNAILWTSQIINNEDFNSNTNHLYDPLALSLQYMISGFCYLELLKQIN